MKIKALIGTTIVLSLSACSPLEDKLSKEKNTDPEQRYTVLKGDEVVLDKVTNLEWMRCMVGQRMLDNECVDYPTSFSSWKAAEKEANTFKFSGHDDWRLPNYTELKSLVFCNTGKPSIFYPEDKCTLAPIKERGIGELSIYKSAFPIQSQHTDRLFSNTTFPSSVSNKTLIGTLNIQYGSSAGVEESIKGYVIFVRNSN